MQCSDMVRVQLPIRETKLTVAIIVQKTFRTFDPKDGVPNLI